MNNIDVSSSNNAKSPIETIEKRINDLKEEQEAIIKVSTQLTQFLHENALTPVNDDILEYIQHFIREEQMKKNGGVQNDGIIDGLNKLLVDYKNEMEILQQGLKMSQTSLATNSSNQTNIVQPEEIFILVGTLYRLPINGAKIRAQVDELKRVQEKFSRNKEQTVNLPAEADSSLLMTDLINILG
jgi:hypothetical protein